MESKSHPIQFGGEISINSESLPLRCTLTRTSRQLSQTKQCFRLLHNRFAIQFHGSLLVVTPRKQRPDQDIITTRDHPSSSHCEDITSSPETSCRRYSLRMRRPTETRLLTFCFFWGGGGRNVMPHMFTSGLVNTTCAHIPCG